jgi:hypothetical protein
LCAKDVINLSVTEDINHTVNEDLGTWYLVTWYFFDAFVVVMVHRYDILVYRHVTEIFAPAEESVSLAGGVCRRFGCLTVVNLLLAEGVPYQS